MFLCARITSPPPQIIFASNPSDLRKSRPRAAGWTYGSLITHDKPLILSEKKIHFLNIFAVRFYFIFALEFFYIFTIHFLFNKILFYCFTYFLLFRTDMLNTILYYDYLAIQKKSIRLQHEIIKSLNHIQVKWWF